MEKEIVDNAVDFLSGTEEFTLKGEKAGFNVLDFWRFQFSNLADMQGRVGEFLVAMALRKETSDNNNGWTLWDIDYRGLRIEVKTTAYYQPWRDSKSFLEQRWGNESSIPQNDSEHNYSEHRNFGITKSRDPQDNEFKRMNDIYVFVINNGKTKEKANPLNLENWEFFVIPTSVINEECGNNKSIGLSKVRKLFKKVYGSENGVPFDELKLTVDRVINQIYGRFTDIDGSVFTKKDGTQWEVRGNKLVQIK